MINPQIGELWITRIIGFYLIRVDKFQPPSPKEPHVKAYGPCWAWDKDEQCWKELVGVHGIRLKDFVAPVAEPS